MLDEIVAGSSFQVIVEGLLYPSAILLMDTVFPVENIFKGNVLVFKAQKTNPTRAVGGLHRHEVPIPQTVSDDIERGTEACLAGTERLFGLLAGGDVAGKGTVEFLSFIGKKTDS